MKLIAYGKVMDDNSKTLKDYSLKDGDFLVVMISKVFNNWDNCIISLNLNLKVKKKKQKMTIKKWLLVKLQVNQLPSKIQGNSSNNNSNHHNNLEEVVQEKSQLIKNKSMI